MRRDGGGGGDADYANGATHWSHDNTSNEKTVAYYALGGGGGGESNTELQMMHASNAPPENAQGGGEVAYAPKGGIQAKCEGANNAAGSGGFSIYVIEQGNEPDTSHLPNQQPTRTPTPRPTKAPTLPPTRVPSDAPVKAEQMVQNSEGGKVWHYPLWNSEFRGCLSSPNPPEVYVSTQVHNGSGIIYLFENRYDCCESWFSRLALQSCMDNLFRMESYSENFGDEVGDEEMEAMSGGATATSDDGGPRPGPDPPPSPGPAL